MFHRMHRMYGPQGRLSLVRLYAPLALTLSAALATAIGAEPQSQDPARVSIENFGKANESYYRGGQPDAAGFAELKRLGIRTVIDLQEDPEPEEPAWVRDAGMQYFNVPLSSRLPATPAQTEYFLSLVNDAQNWPVYVHCAGGRHRTGEMTAIYRINHDSWTADHAYQEMKQFGYYSFGGHGPLRDYVYQYYRNYLAAQAKRPASPVNTPATR